MVEQSKNKSKVLLVDKNLDDLDLLDRLLTSEFEVLKAESGPVALKILAKEGEVAVIISSQRLPSMSGTELFSLTATQYPDIIRIILTSYTDAEDLVEAINSGKVFKYITKPWDGKDLKAVVRQAVDTHSVLKARTQELRRTLRQESLLNAINNTIRSALSYRQILQTIVETVGHMFEVDCCLLRPFQDNRMGDELFVYTARAAENNNSPESLKEKIWNLNNLVYTVWETRNVHVIPDVMNYKSVQSDPSEIQRVEQVYEKANIRSSLVVPLICRQELMAVMVLHQCDQPRAWQDDEVQLIVMVADQAALVLFQARTYEQFKALTDRRDEMNTNTTGVIRSIEFPPEYREAGISILTYFSHILKVKYPDMKTKVRIEQEDLLLRMVVDTSDGQREKVEKTLEEYGMVVSGKLPVEFLLEDPLEIMALKHKLEIAHLELRQTRNLLNLVRDNSQQRIESLEIQVDKLHALIERGLQSGDNIFRVVETMTNQEGRNYDFRGAKFGGGFASEGGFQVGGTFLDVSSSSDLSEAAKQIQELLHQLQSEGLTLEEAQQQAAKELMKQAGSNPSVMGKLVNWGKSLADTAGKTTVSEAARGVVKLALQMAGIPLP